MEQLTGLDASFLYLETPSLHMHVSMAAVFDPSTVPGGYSFDKLRSLVGSRLARAPIFRRRLVEVPFRLGHPYWVDDPSFDIDYHMRRAALPTPGGMAELGRFVGDVCSRQLDRTKPLWEMYIVEGVRIDQIAVVTKIHHSTIDGVSGAELLAQLFDLEPDPPSAPVPAAGTGPGAEEALPSEAHLVGRALAARVIKPVGVGRLMWRTGRAVLDVRRVRSRSSGRAALPLTTPRTSLNAAITPHRSVAFSSISLEDVKRLKRACGTTVNDVVLALCTGAVRRYLLEGDELPSDPLVATVPVSVAPEVGNRRGANKISAMFVALPCQIEDPLERLEAIRQGTKGAKEEHNALGAAVLLDWAEHATPNVFSAAARTYTRFKLADHHRPIHSMIISNVPGPDFPLYLAGAEMVAGFPLGPVMDGAGLNITVMSYRGVLNWGFMACTENVPRTAALAASVPGVLDELLGAAGLAPATPAGVASGVPEPTPRRRSTDQAPGPAPRPAGDPAAGDPAAASAAGRRAASGAGSRTRPAVAETGPARAGR
ncbi:MAG TPA: wax ester/triacylglycerol synthase family O-acyltransferase [Acidimicrobiales bacterium]|nr:wax ester/triacylglycerol synthase family O-acyltransferase [Acidimicrobiales bacterium]